MGNGKRNILILILFMTLFSCEHENSMNIELFPDSSNYEYYLQKNGLIKVIRFFPKTKDTSQIYYFDKYKGVRDSILYNYDKEGNILDIVQYSNSMKKINFQFFYKNGNLKKECIMVDSQYVGDIKHYYTTGTLKAVHEVIYINGKKYLNSEKAYDIQGNLDTSKTFYFDMKVQKDTISMNDSVLIKMNEISPKEALYAVFTGAIDENFNIVNYNKLEYIPTYYFYYKPDSFGINDLRVIFEIKIPNKNGGEYFKRIYKEKEIYVTK